MCEFKSMIVMQSEILYSKKHDNHRKLLEERNISDNSIQPNFVKIELVPKNFDYENLDSYIFKIDQNFFPEWWCEQEAEIACREILNKIMIFPLIVFPGDLKVYGSAKFDALKLTTIGGNCKVSGYAKLDALKLKSVNGKPYMIKGNK